MDEHVNTALARPLHQPPRPVAGANRSSRQSAAVAIGIAVIVALAVGLALALALAFVVGDRTEGLARDATHAAVAGYPAHYGLAGPSRAGSSGSSWPGYPPHFGLAGPSRVGTPASRSGIGEGYPPHYGLAGSSQLGGQ